LFLGLSLHLFVQLSCLREPHQVVGSGADAGWRALATVVGVHARLLLWVRGWDTSVSGTTLRCRVPVLKTRCHIQQFKLREATRARC